jgi:hypothetical protein
MRRHIAIKLTHTLFVVLALTCVLLYGLITNADTREARAQAHLSPADLVAAHDCWSGEAPDDMAGRMPGHVVVTVAGEPRYAGPRMVAKALDQVFGDVDHGLTVHAFCR